MPEYRSHTALSIVFAGNGVHEGALLGSQVSSRVRTVATFGTTQNRGITVLRVEVMGSYPGPWKSQLGRKPSFGGFDGPQGHTECRVI